MSSTVTVTAKQGIAFTVTAKVISNVRAFTLDCDRQLLKVTDAADFVNDYDVSAATTITATASAGSYTLTIS